jgi:hypothetical protein
MDHDAMFDHQIMVPQDGTELVNDGVGAEEATVKPGRI